MILYKGNSTASTGVDQVETMLKAGWSETKVAPKPVAKPAAKPVAKPVAKPTVKA